MVVVEEVIVNHHHGPDLGHDDCLEAGNVGYVGCEPGVGPGVGLGWEVVLAEVVYGNQVVSNF
jgi:hypothetical protein